MSTTTQRVSMILLNLAAEGVGRDEEGKELEAILTEIGSSTTCCTARSYLSSKSETREECADMISWKQLQQQILRYIKVHDRYLSLASVLLKSRAFHEAYPRDEHQKPIIELPRTIHNKPFIPSENSPLSVSHQYPFVGMVQLVPKEQQKRHRLAGFDIVVFEKINPRLYDNVQEFVDVFCDSFTPNEWTALNDVARCPDDEGRLRELYLRWATKEAYTKALGVGLGFDFSTFETSLDSPDNSTSLWEWLSTVALLGERLQTTGTVTQVATGARAGDATRPHQERWVFVFQPLYTDYEAAADDEGPPRHHRMTGCGCACIGPIANGDDGADLSFSMQWTTIKDLIAWHCN